MFLLFSCREQFESQELTHQEPDDGEEDGEHVEGDLGVAVAAAGEEQLARVVIFIRAQGAYITLLVTPGSDRSSPDH